MSHRKPRHVPLTFDRNSQSSVTTSSYNNSTVAIFTFLQLKEDSNFQEGLVCRQIFPLQYLVVNPLSTFLLVSASETGRYVCQFHHRAVLFIKAKQVSHSIQECRRLFNFFLDLLFQLYFLFR